MSSSPVSHRPLLLAVVVLTATLAGCLGQAGSSDCSAGTVTPVSSPDRPETLTNETVTSYVRALERAHVTSTVPDADTTRLSFNATPDSVSRTADGWTARVRTGLTIHRCENGVESVGDSFYTARYFLNDSGVYRSEAGPGETPTAPQSTGKRIDDQ